MNNISMWETFKSNFICECKKVYKASIGKHVASGLAGFVGGFLIATLVYGSALFYLGELLDLLTSVQ